MKAGITLIECMVYLAGMALMALLLSSFLVTIMHKRNHEMMATFNHYLACHSIIQRLSHDVHAARFVKGQLGNKKPESFCLVTDRENIEWSYTKGRIIRTSLKRGEKPVVSVMASKDVQFSCKYHYNGLDITVVYEQVTMQRYFCMEDIVCSSTLLLSSPYC